MAKSTCSVDGCEKKVDARGWCSMHYARWRTTGSPERKCPTCGTNINTKGLQVYCSDACKPRCSVEGCDGHVRKRGWCASHYTQWSTTGEAKPFKFKWAEPGGKCVVCDEPVMPGTGRRRHCSGACQQADSRGRRPAQGAKPHGPREPKTSRPTHAVCRLCGKEFSLARREDSGRLQRTDTLWCRGCGRSSPEALRFKRYGIRPEDYEAALAKGCPICHRQVAKLDVDHDHGCCPPRTHRLCGKCTRGLICGDCNRGLGLFRDNLEALTRAREYLAEYS